MAAATSSRPGPEEPRDRHTRAAADSALANPETLGRGIALVLVLERTAWLTVLARLLFVSGRPWGTATRSAITRPGMSSWPTPAPAGSARCLRRRPTAGRGRSTTRRATTSRRIDVQPYRVRFCPLIAHVCTSWHGELLRLLHVDYTSARCSTGSGPPLGRVRTPKLA